MLAICLSGLMGSFVSAFVPAVNAELLLLGLAAAAPPVWILPVVMLTTIGQMAGKLLLYLAARGVVRLPGGRAGAWLERAAARVEGHERVGGTVLFASAFTGLPPFYLTAIGAGFTRFHLGQFLLLGSAGRFLRFAAVALVPLWWKTGV